MMSLRRNGQNNNRCQKKMKFNKNDTALILQAAQLSQRDRATLNSIWKSYEVDNDRLI